MAASAHVLGTEFHRLGWWNSEICQSVTNDWFAADSFAVT